MTSGASDPQYDPAHWVVSGGRGAGDCSRAQETPETPEEMPEDGSTNLTNRSASPPPSFWTMLDSRVRD